MERVLEQDQYLRWLVAHIEQQQAKIRALELRPEQEQFVRVIHDNNYHKKRDTEVRKLARLREE
jgi:hypothetical protein